MTLVTEPSDIAKISAFANVLAIVPGAWHEELLMDGIRAVVDADQVLGANGEVLTGAGIRMANRERIGTGSGHEDFYEHDLAGNPTLPRWTPLAPQQCIDTTAPAFYLLHAQMAAGIMLGNGWQSARNSGQPLAFRGIAPEATYDCYQKVGARPHVSSHSYVHTSNPTNTDWDAAIVGDLTIERFHAHVAAGGNSGLDLGYFSIKNNAENALIVGNTQVNGYIHPSNSSGPTYDGRIKTDIAAPTRNLPPRAGLGVRHRDRWHRPNAQHCGGVQMAIRHRHSSVASQAGATPTTSRSLAKPCSALSKQPPALYC